MELFEALVVICCAGNLVSVLVINSTELGLKLSFRRLISQLCVLDTVSVILNILLFSAPFHSEHYRVQVSSRGQDSSIGFIYFANLLLRDLRNCF